MASKRELIAWYLSRQDRTLSWADFGRQAMSASGGLIQALIVSAYLPAETNRLTKQDLINLSHRLLIPINPLTVRRGDVFISHREHLDFAGLALSPGRVVLYCSESKEISQINRLYCWGKQCHWYRLAEPVSDYRTMTWQEGALPLGQAIYPVKLD